MVGYQKNDSMTPNEKLIAGCVSGATTRFITQPLDVVKLRTQLQRKDTPRPTGRFFKYTRRIWSEEGITAFWLGHNLGQIHSITAVSCQFYVYEQATRFVALHELDTKVYKPVVTYACGFVSGCTTAMVVIPLEVIRVRQMLVKDQYKGLLNGAREVYNRGGIFAFYEGITASLLQMGPAVGLTFSVFSIVQPLILNRFKECGKECHHAPGNDHEPHHLLIATTVAGWTAGLVSKTLTYPFDLAKRRMQIQSHKTDGKFDVPSMSRNLAACHSLTECIVKTYKDEGVKGLFRGWKITIYKAQLTSVVAFTTYELVCYFMREIEQ